MSPLVAINAYQIETTRQRLLPKLEERSAHLADEYPLQWQDFWQRLDDYFDDLLTDFYQLYATEYDFYFHFEQLLDTICLFWQDRATELKSRDKTRYAAPDWFQSNQMLGGVCYVDRFSGDLAGLDRKMGYLQEMGLNYLHLMPLFAVPEGENDGGYAVSSYREVNPKIGSMQQLREVAAHLHENGINLVLDLIYNHTADNHIWAEKAKQGNPCYQKYYYMFPDRSMPDAYERTLREIFPDEHSGSFTWHEKVGQWVWTTFHAYQWDLNYSNPEVFNRMAEEMLFLANIVVDVLRLDAVAFTWKELGTACENLPQAHILIQAFNTVARIACPALLFKSEAIVHPDEVIKYIKPEECQLSYNPLLMALLWNTLATRETNQLTQALQNRFQLPEGTAWVNYVRVHDDIGWTFSDEDAWQFGINGYDHRKFLNAFYTGRFPGSFARGLPFQENPKTGDMRISGTLASLAGLEKALKEETEVEVALAIKRILLLHALILTTGGIPLIYLGDEVGMLNDYEYRANPALADDSRWVHRPVTDWEKIEHRNEPGSLQQRVYQGLQKLIRLRKEHEVFSGNQLQAIESGNPHVLSYLRGKRDDRVLVVANFSEQEQSISADILRSHGLENHQLDLLSGELLPPQGVRLAPYQVLFLRTHPQSEDI